MSGTQRFSNQPSSTQVHPNIDPAGASISADLPRPVIIVQPDQKKSKQGVNNLRSGSLYEVVDFSEMIQQR